MYSDTSIQGENGGYNQLNLLDIKPPNYKFTWSNRWVRTSHVSTKLDHFLVGSSFLEQHISFSCSHLSQSGSNHRPIKNSISYMRILALFHYVSMNCRYYSQVSLKLHQNPGLNGYWDPQYIYLGVEYQVYQISTRKMGERMLQ